MIRRGSPPSRRPPPCCSRAVVAACSRTACAASTCPAAPPSATDPYRLTIEFADVLDLVPQSLVKVDDVPVGTRQRHQASARTGRRRSPCSSTATSRCPPTRRPGCAPRACWARSSSSSPRRRTPARATGLADGAAIPLARTSRARRGRGGPRRAVAAAQRRRHRPDPDDLQRAEQGAHRQRAARSARLLDDLDHAGRRDLDSHKTEITAALDGINRLSATLPTAGARSRPRSTTSPRASRSWTDQRGAARRHAAGARPALRTSRPTWSTAAATTWSPTSSCSQPVLAKLAESGPDLVELAGAAAHLPVHRRLGRRRSRATTPTSTCTLDLDLSHILQNLARSGQPFPGPDGPLPGAAAHGRSCSAPCSAPPAPSLPKFPLLGDDGLLPLPGFPARRLDADPDVRLPGAAEQHTRAQRGRRDPRRPAGRRPVITKAVRLQLIAFLLSPLSGSATRGSATPDSATSFGATTTRCGCSSPTPAASSPTRGDLPGRQRRPRRRAAADPRRRGGRPRHLPTTRRRSPPTLDAAVANLSAIGEQYVDLQPAARRRPVPRRRRCHPARRRTCHARCRSTDLLGNLDDFIRSVPPGRCAPSWTSWTRRSHGTGAAAGAARLLDAFTADAAERCRRPCADRRRPHGAHHPERRGRALPGLQPDLSLLADQLRNPTPTCAGCSSPARTRPTRSVGLLRESGPGLSQLLADLLTVSRVAEPRQDGLRQLLVTYPGLPRPRLHRGARRRHRPPRARR